MRASDTTSPANPRSSAWHSSRMHLMALAYLRAWGGGSAGRYSVRGVVRFGFPGIKGTLKRWTGPMEAHTLCAHLMYQSKASKAKGEALDAAQRTADPSRTGPRLPHGMPCSHGTQWHPHAEPTHLLCWPEMTFPRLARMWPQMDLRCPSLVPSCVARRLVCFHAACELDLKAL